MAPTTRPERRTRVVLRSVGGVVGVGRARVGRLGRAGRTLRGQGIVEYGLILSLSAVLTLVLLVFFGGTVSAVLNAVGDAIDAAS